MLSQSKQLVEMFCFAFVLLLATTIPLQFTTTTTEEGDARRLESSRITFKHDKKRRTATRRRFKAFSNEEFESVA